MTGKDLILYILQNNLENEPIVDDSGKFIGFLSVDEVAIEFNVGKATVKTWVDVGLLDGVKVGGSLYILPTDNLRVTRVLRTGCNASNKK